MSDREAFESAIRLDPFNDVLRKVYADWLQENGFDDEALRQRDWETVVEESREWIETFAFEIEESHDGLMEAAQRYLEGDGWTEDSTGAASMESIGRWEQFWGHYEIVKGINVADRQANFYVNSDRVRGYDDDYYLCPSC